MEGKVLGAKLGGLVVVVLITGVNEGAAVVVFGIKPVNVGKRVGGFVGLGVGSSIFQNFIIFLQHIV